MTTRPVPAADWPESWRLSHRYDRLELWGAREHLGYSLAYAQRQAATLALLDEALPAGATVLDLAAAQGNFSIAMARRGWRVTWNDLRADLAGYVRLKAGALPLAFAPGNAFELAFGAPFDAVLATEVIEHVAHPDRFLAQAAALVRPGGCIVVSTPNGAYARNTLPRFDACDPQTLEAGQFKPDADGHLFLLHPDELCTLAARAGLVVERLLLFTNPLSAGHLKTEALLRRLPAARVQALEAASRRLPARLQRRLLVHMAARLRLPA